jgi:hypothetical protein
MSSARLLRLPAGAAEAVVGDRGTRARRALGADRCAAAAAEATPLPLSRPPADRRPRRTRRHRVRAQDRDHLEPAAHRSGRLLGGDLLAPAAGLNPGRRLAGVVRRPRLRPRHLRRQLRARGITPRIARRGVAHGSGLARHRWVVERGFAWLHASNGYASVTNVAPTSTSNYVN